MKMSYRADIDGLRAIAVLAVVLNHAGISLFSGGFIGVDVFFVISGYLITNIIVREIELDEFSFVRFYERRIRRILPALFVVVIFTIVVCAIMYDAEKFMDFGRSVVATTLFASNINFWKESGYFDAPSQLKPLLHAWSLAVEEQFYIFFPLFLFLVYRYVKKISPFILAGMAALSFGLAIYNTSNNPSAAFYLAHMRAWELLIGSMLAVNIIPAGFGKEYTNVIGILGLAMIAIPIFEYTESTKFPGVSALAPVLGAVLVLVSGGEGKSLVGQFLSLPSLVFIGKISYSLYLWHWPLLVIEKYYLIRKMVPTDIAVWLIVTFIMSILSWKLVENPFRDRAFINRSQIYLFAGIVVFLSFVTGVTIYVSKGFPQRFSSDLVNPNNTVEWDMWGKCVINRIKSPLPKVSLCTVGLYTKEPSFLVWGDSHLRALAPGINDSAVSAKVNGYVSIMPACPPLLGIDRLDEYTGICSAYNDMLLNYIKTQPQLKTVILVARWALPANGTRFKNEEGTTVKLVDVWTDQKAQNPILFDLGFNRTVAKLLELNRNIVIVTGIPEIGYDVSSSFTIASHTGRDLNAIIAPTRQEYLNRNHLVMSTINKIASENNIQLIDPSDALCDKRACYVVINKQPLYLDDDHLSPFGAHFISHIFDPVLGNLTDN